MEHFNLNTGILDLILVILGFLFGQATKFRTPIMVAMLIIKMAKWYIDTHPRGKDLAKKTDLDEKLNKIVEREYDGPLG